MSAMIALAGGVVGGMLFSLVGPLISHKSGTSEQDNRRDELRIRRLTLVDMPADSRSIYYHSDVRRPARVPARHRSR